MSNRTRVAIIGASYLQLPLIERAKKEGFETHVFAWKKEDVGEKAADYFYPISITEKEAILEKCREIGISGICSIASDLATITVNYVANEMGLIGNSMRCTKMSTNKHLMRKAFENNKLPSPWSILVSADTLLSGLPITYPVIVKPTDRSGSRGVFLVEDKSRFELCVKSAIEFSFEKKALIESYICGREYSIECISFHGKHQFLAATRKYTTGAPRFIETGQYEPADLNEEKLNEIIELVYSALDALEITNGASHSEIIIDNDGKVWIVEIGARMGGDLIGSHLVRESTGIDMVKAVLDVCLDNEPCLREGKEKKAAGVRYVFDDDSLAQFMDIHDKHPEILVCFDIPETVSGDISDSSQRPGYFLISDFDDKIIERYMPPLVMNEFRGN